MMSRESKSAATIRRKRKAREVLYRSKSHEGEELFDSGEEDLDFCQDDPLNGPAILKLIMASEWTMFLGLLAFRIVNSLMIQTAFVPDEYWQSIEVAHNLAFGYGYKTWEWREGLRGFAYPLIFTIQFKILAVFNLDSRLLLIKLPRLTQAFFAALCDIYLYKLSRKLQGQRAAHWTLFCQLCSWFTFYASTRTLTNSMETTLTTMALFYFPWPGKPRKAWWKYIGLVGLAVVVRPTAAIVWIPLCVWHVWLFREMAFRVVKRFAEAGFIILLLSSLLDWMFYGKFVNVQYNFLQFNVLNNLGTFYGTHPWHWYMTQGLPVILGSHIFFFILALRKHVEKIMIGVIAWTVFVYSLLEHKEFRFLFPVLPMCMHVCGTYIRQICEDIVIYSKKEDSEPSDCRDDISEGVDPAARTVADTKNTKDIKFSKKLITTFLLITNLPLAMYFGLLHQRGTVDVMRYIHEESFKHKIDNMEIMFLMPCHSTPYYSYIHRNIPMRFLTCEPNLKKVENHQDEADVFFKDPLTWLREEYKATPSHLVMFSVLPEKILPFLTDHHYRECARFFHTHVPEGRIGSHVLVFCKSPPQPSKTKVTVKPGKVQR